MLVASPRRLLHAMNTVNDGECSTASPSTCYTELAHSQSPKLIAADSDRGRFSFPNNIYTMPPVGTTAMGGETIPTLNQFGWQFPIDTFSARFVEDAVRNSTAEHPALELGAAYGVATPRALEHGAYMIANDIDQRHLSILAENIPFAQRSRLTLVHGAFPHQISNAIKPASLSAVLVANLLHFFDGPTITQSIDTLKRWVKPGGSIYIVAFSVHQRLSSAYLTLYEASRDAGVPFPGFQYRDTVIQLAQTLPLTATFTEARRTQVLSVLHQLGPTIHWMDAEVLRRVVRESGLEVVACEYFPCAPNMPTCKDGREMVGCIARRPLLDTTATTTTTTLL